LRDGTRVGLRVEAVDDAGLGEVVLRHLHFHAIAGGQADEALAHLARDMGQDDVLAVVQLDAKHRAGKDRDDPAFNFDDVCCVVLCHVSGTIYTEGHLRQCLYCDFTSGLVVIEPISHD